MAGKYVRISQRPHLEACQVETMAVHFSNSGNTDVDSVPISELRDVFKVKLNRKNHHIIWIVYLSIFVLKRRHALSHAKDQNNTSDIIGITLIVSFSLSHTHWAQ